MLERNILAVDNPLFSVELALRYKELHNKPMSVEDLENYRKRIMGEVPSSEKEVHKRNAIAMVEKVLADLGTQYGTILMPRDLVNNKKLKDELLRKLPPSFPFAYVNLEEIIKILQERKVKI